MIPCFRNELCKVIAGRVIGKLQVNTKDMQSAGGTLSSLWDELCVQVQGAPFFFWESYLEEARELIRDEVVQLQEDEKGGLWLELREWMDAHGGAGAAPDQAAAVDYILDQYLLAEAATWRDPQIEAFIDGAGGSCEVVC